MMSKPLILFLQLTGLIVLLYGAGTESAAKIVIGIILVIIGGIGYRERIK